MCYLFIIVHNKMPTINNPNTEWQTYMLHATSYMAKMALASCRCEDTRLNGGRNGEAERYTSF